MTRLCSLIAALLGLSACGPHFYDLRLQAVQRQPPDIPIPPDSNAARPGWQGVFVELRSERSFRAHIVRHSMTFGLGASLCDSADASVASLRRWGGLRRTLAWDVVGELEQHLQIAEAPAPYRYWLGLETISVSNAGRDGTPNPLFERVSNDLRTGTRGVCIYGRGFDWPRGEWFTNVIYIPAETLREASRQEPR